MYSPQEHFNRSFFKSFILCRKNDFHHCRYSPSLSVCMPLVMEMIEKIAVVAGCHVIFRRNVYYERKIILSVGRLFSGNFPILREYDHV